MNAEAALIMILLGSFLTVSFTLIVLKIYKEKNRKEQN
jgi:hypothetical protein